MSAAEHDSVRDLAAAYALGALSPEESREFEAYLASSPEAQREVAEYRDVAALLQLQQSEGRRRPTPGGSPPPAPSNCYAAP